MIQGSWDVSEAEDDDQTWPAQPSPILVNFHFIRSALRRRWLVCALSAILGLLMAVGFLVVFHPHSAKATLALVHEEGVDPSLAMSTDVGLLQSQAVAAKTIARLSLATTPDRFSNSVTVEQVSTDLLSMTLAAPTDEEAVRRLAAFTSVYLSFRGEQLSMQSDALVAAMQRRIQKLEGERNALSRQVDQLAKARGSEASKLSETVSKRANVQSQIDNLQQSIEDTDLRNSSVVASSRVIDPAAAERGGGKRRMVLVLASGLMGGAALGCGMVLFFAITSDRLRRRADIADTVEAPVRVSVRRIAPIPDRWLWVPHTRTLDGSYATDRKRLAHAVEMELPVPRERGRLAVACSDNADEVRFAVATAGLDLVAEGRSVALVDLTEKGSLDIQFMSSLAAPSAQPTVLRPEGIPELARVADLRVVGQEQESTHSLELYDVVLVLADLNPSVGADHLTAWTDRVIIVVTSGRSRAERLRTAADLVRAVGLDLRFIALLHTERTDDSMGRWTARIEQADSESADHEEQRLSDNQPPVSAAGTTQLEAAGDQQLDRGDVQTETALAGDNQVAVLEQYDDLQIVSEEHPTNIEITTEGQPTELQAQEEQTGAEVGGHEPEVEVQQAFDERVREEEKPEVVDGTDSELSARARGEAEAQLVDEEQSAKLQDLPAEEGEEEHALETDRAADADQALEPPVEEAVVNRQQVDIAVDPLAHESSASNSDGGASDWSWERILGDPDTQLLTTGGWHADVAESPQALVNSPPSSDPDGLNRNPASSFDDPGSNLEALDGWPLYIDEYPQAHLEAALGTEQQEVDYDWELYVPESGQDLAVATGEEAYRWSDEPPPNSAINGEFHQLLPEHNADGHTYNGAHPVGNRQAANGQSSSGPRRVKARTRNRRWRSGLK